MSTSDGPAVAEIVAVHRVFRREFAVLPALVRGVATPTRNARRWWPDTPG